jgi:hypothetical protein
MMAGKGQIIFAFAAIYPVCGVDIVGHPPGLRTAPRLFAAGIRFSTAGAILYACAQITGQPNRRPGGGKFIASQLHHFTLRVLGGTALIRVSVVL